MAGIDVSVGGRGVAVLGPETFGSLLAFVGENMQRRSVVVREI
jgi:hypothetical protein